MNALSSKSSLKDYQHFIDEVYGPSNHRHFTPMDMLANIERFAMRSLKGIRKHDDEKTKINVLITLGWFLSLMSLYDIAIENVLWRRFPYRCSYCGTCPCSCKEKRVQKRKILRASNARRPKTLVGFQQMFGAIYPASKRTLEHAGIHFAEEIGELSEAVLRFRYGHTENDFGVIELEAADIFSCSMGICNSLGIDLGAELARSFAHGCHVCRKIPCQCEYSTVMNFKS